MPETLYERYKRVLQEIAHGVEDPQALAAEAIRPRKQPPTYHWKEVAETRKKEFAAKKAVRLLRAQAIYAQWVKANYSPIASFGRKFEMSRSSMYRLLYIADRELPKDERRLDWFCRTRDYRPAKEARDIKHIKFMVWDACPHIGNLTSDQWRLASHAIEKAVAATYYPGESDIWHRDAAIKYMKANYSEVWEQFICPRAVASS